MWIDIVLLVVAGLGFMVGFSRGIIKTIFVILSYGLGIVAAIRFTPSMTNLLKQVTGEQSALMFIAGMILSFTITMLVIRLFARGIEGMLQTANINIINQAAGGALTASVAILVYAVLLNFIIASSPQGEREITEGSSTYTYIKEYPELVWQVAKELKEPAQKFWDYAIDMMDQVEDITERADSENYFYDIEEDNKDSEPNVNE
ncbi:MAG TPA: CvpA family protein [Saprospiraceae bacterium]|nr:CvpA family protein [Saprospiraceae bacterium]